MMPAHASSARTALQAVQGTRLVLSWLCWLLPTVVIKVNIFGPISISISVRCTLILQVRHVNRRLQGHGLVNMYHRQMLINHMWGSHNMLPRRILRIPCSLRRRWQPGGTMHMPRPSGATATATAPGTPGTHGAAATAMSLVAAAAAETLAAPPATRCLDMVPLSAQLVPTSADSTTAMLGFE